MSERISAQKQLVIDKVRYYERMRAFDMDVNEDPPAPQLLPKDADYFCKRLKNKVGRFFANAIADRYFLRLIKKDVLAIDGIEGEQYVAGALKDGAVIVCNHFSPYDNYIIFHCIRKYLPKKYLYKIIREGNYTNFPGLYGFFFRHCNTLPLSSNMKTMGMLMDAVDTLLKDGNSILIYPEQAMWPYYKKVRPFKPGGFRMAFKAGVPVLPMFISMKDDPKKNDDGYPRQRHTLHVLPPIYPDSTLNEKQGATDMATRAFNACKSAYEAAYGCEMTYDEEN